jgi:hypothetical protein
VSFFKAFETNIFGNMKEQKSIKETFDFFKALRTYWLQLVTSLVFLGSVFGYGITYEQSRATKSQEKQELKSLKDSTVYYYRATRSEVSGIKTLTQGTFDTVRRLSTRLLYYTSKVDLLTSSYKESLIINPYISKEQYRRLTNSIDNLTEELKKNAYPIQ